jgi:putative sterol carrier protein
MDKEQLQVKILFYIMLKSLEEVAKVDEDLQDELEDFEGKIQWEIGDFKGYQVFEDGKVIGIIDEELDDPDVTMIMEDLDQARNLFSGELDGTTAYMSGDLKIEGDMQIAMRIGTFTEFIMEYMEPLLEG